MKIDDMQQEDLYGDWNMSLKKTQNNAAPDPESKSRWKLPKPSKLDELEAVLEVAAILTLICGLVTPARQAFWITLLVFGVLAFVIHLVQSHMHFL